MKHYVMGFVFNKTGSKVLLMRKNKPDWQAGKWNGIGGKIEDYDISPEAAMQREGYEEVGNHYNWEHCLTFICPGGTVYVYRVFDYLHYGCDIQCNDIHYKQNEESLKEGTLDVWFLNNLPHNMMENLSWIIPICHAKDIQFPVLIQENTLGVE